MKYKILILLTTFSFCFCYGQKKKPKQPYLNPYEYTYKIDSIPIVIKNGHLQVITGKQRRDYDARWIDSLWLVRDDTWVIYRYRSGEFYDKTSPSFSQ